MPRYPLGPLPEMACFDPGKCSCLRYDVGAQGNSDDEENKLGGAPDVGDGPSSGKQPRATFFLGNCYPRRHSGFVPAGAARLHDFYSSHCHWRGVDRGGEPSQCVWMRQHWPQGGGEESGPPCLVTTYRRAVVVCDNASSQWTSWHRARARLPPTHDWFHAMDPDSYGQLRGTVPRCEDRACLNYYKRPRRSNVLMTRPNCTWPAVASLESAPFKLGWRDAMDARMGWMHGWDAWRDGMDACGEMGWAPTAVSPDTCLIL